MYAPPKTLEAAVKILKTMLRGRQAAEEITDLTSTPRPALAVEAAPIDPAKGRAARERAERERKQVHQLRGLRGGQPGIEVRRPCSKLFRGRNGRMQNTWPGTMVMLKHGTRTMEASFLVNPSTNFARRSLLEGPIACRGRLNRIRTLNATIP